MYFSLEIGFTLKSFKNFFQLSTKPSYFIFLSLFFFLMIDSKELWTNVPPEEASPIYSSFVIHFTLNHSSNRLSQSQSNGNTNSTIELTLGTQLLYLEGRVFSSSSSIGFASQIEAFSSGLVSTWIGTFFFTWSLFRASATLFVVINFNFNFY